MRGSLCCLLLTLFAWGCGPEEGKKVELKDLMFKCVITNPVEDEVIRVSINGKEQVFEVPENGVVEIKASRIAPQYSEVMYGLKVYPVYLVGGEPMEMAFDGNEDNWNRKFSGGAKAINDYLSSSISLFESSYFSDNEEKLSENTKKLLEKNWKNLERKGLPEDFVAVEKERLRYEAYGSWYSYRMNHRWMTGDETFEPGEAYYKTLRELAKERKNLVGMMAYYNYVRRSIATLVSKGVEELSPNDLIRREVKYIVENYKDSILVEELMHDFVYEYILEYGLKGQEDLVELYKKNVKSAAKLMLFEQMCNTWLSLCPGTPSPVFNLPDANGKMMSLEAMRGKFVYIDLWASWCGPCHREIPFLKRLEKKFAGKNIVFVGISCDTDKEAWLKAMQNEGLDGIQLYMGDDLVFAKAYMVSNLPRFILVDPEGNIVEAYMTAPSNPETEERLQKLFLI